MIYIYTLLHYIFPNSQSLKKFPPKKSNKSPISQCHPARLLSSPLASPLASPSWSPRGSERSSPTLSPHPSSALLSEAANFQLGGDEAPSQGPGVGGGFFPVDDQVMIRKNRWTTICTYRMYVPTYLPTYIHTYTHIHRYIDT